jgi:trehalose 6-phosphate synthase
VQEDGMISDRRLIVVSNRLPITIETGSRMLVTDSSGGLISALIPVLNRSGGCWIGWTGTDHTSGVDVALTEWCSRRSYSFAPVFLTAEEIRRYYQGFSNEIVWPLFHGLPSRCQFGITYWNGYCRVNEKFADVVQRVSEKDDFIWVHDYHLMKLAEVLRRHGLRQRLAYFHHIPFPCPDVFETLPWRVEVLRALLDFDLLGFQTSRDRRNFIACLEHCLPRVGVGSAGNHVRVRAEARSVLVGTYPISIDYEAFAGSSTDSDIDSGFEPRAQDTGKLRTIIGVDRLDYTKGIPERLQGFQRLLQRNPDLRGTVRLMQIVVPSREELHEYKQLRLRIETLVSNINGEFSRPGWIPIHYFYRTVPRDELISHYRGADVAAVTPLRDGMNLVAKEFCAAKTNGRGVLVLSEFAGAAEELKKGALLVNPNDTDAVASSFENALSMPLWEQRRRMEAMQSHLRAHDVFQWAQSFIRTAEDAANVVAPAATASLTKTFVGDKR